MKWSLEQQNAIAKVVAWLRDPHAQQVFYLAGYAGTGKTTLAKHLVSLASGRWHFAAFTGKAAFVLKQKGCWDASTIHSLIYRPAGMSKAEELKQLDIRIAFLSEAKDLTAEQKERLKQLKAYREEVLLNRRPQFSIWDGSPLFDPEVEGVVVDEVSMVDEYLGRDLESFKKKILVLGDPAQLPPVGSGGYFTKREPDVMLTEIHRQAEESGVLRLATLVRSGGSIASFPSCDDVIVCRKRDVDPQELGMAVIGADQVLVGYNETRDLFNQRMRELLGKSDPGPMPGDRLMCLRNDRSAGVFNGSQWKVLEAHNDLDTRCADLVLISEDDSTTKIGVDTWLHHMLGLRDRLKNMESEDRRSRLEFDWSYSITVHKAQGSQWNDVVLFDEPIGDPRRWRYTGITRAAKRLTVVI